MRASPYLKFVLLAVICFSLAVVLQPRTDSWTDRGKSDSVLNLLFGDSRRLFANQFFVEADVTFHSGYYPSFFDQAEKPTQSPMVSGHDDHDDHAHASDEGDHEDHHDAAEEAHEREMSFLGKPLDWIEAFGRHFFVTQHTHLSGGREREILPWLRISASLDPQRVETYTVSAYWLRSRLGKVKEAEDFLREGLRSNPNNPEILFELGRLYNENHHDAVGARNLWELALRRWRETEANKKDPDKVLFGKITDYLGQLEENEGNYEKAISYFEMAMTASPNPKDLEKRIAEVKHKMAPQQQPSPPTEP